MGNPVTFAASLYARLHRADAAVRSRVKRALQETMDSGAIPLGMCEEDGKPAYLWLVYDQARFASPEAMRRYLQGRTPPNVPMVVLTI